ncbi:hypothetical protein BU26DRAFT_281996 [Trematosphaeria pertusa]|uniref:Uncharacterized protein n=1 Tax=Trematosphaeria pertusa TaxID=390896 RepID=A0A6A6IL94_9PLEO|nr:uncharacterized protein BU26DRAFT_281996 [Trematosphaeria pertusa]KAF2251384.1 hypothetical protein BU26DRAFT_281996 [Trematosphaeria pertusa]
MRNHNNLRHSHYQNDDHFRSLCIRHAPFINRHGHLHHEIVPPAPSRALAWSSGAPPTPFTTHRPGLRIPRETAPFSAQTLRHGASEGRAGEAFCADGALS